MCSVKQGAHKNFACEFYKIFKNTFFYRIPPMAASMPTGKDTITIRKNTVDKSICTKLILMTWGDVNVKRHRCHWCFNINFQQRPHTLFWKQLFKCCREVDVLSKRCFRQKILTNVIQCSQHLECFFKKLLFLFQSQVTSVRLKINLLIFKHHRYWSHNVQVSFNKNLSLAFASPNYFSLASNFFPISFSR